MSGKGNTSVHDSSDSELMDVSAPLEEGYVDRIQIDVTKCNGEKFWNLIPDSEIRKVWTFTLKRSFDEVESHGFKQIQKQCLRLNFILKNPTKIVEISSTPDLSFSYNILGKPNLFFARIRGYETAIPTPKIGDTVTITVLRTFSEVGPEHITAWLSHFGVTVGRHYFDKDSEGNPTGNYHIKLVLAHHIPEFLPIYGIKARVYYPGMLKQCRKCYRVGHLQKACEKERIQWIDFVERLVQTNLYPKKLFGSWIEILVDKYSATPGKLKVTIVGDKQTRKYIPARGPRNRSESREKYSEARRDSRSPRRDSRSSQIRGRYPRGSYHSGRYQSRRSPRRDRYPHWESHRERRRSPTRDRSPERDYYNNRSPRRDRSPRGRDNYQRYRSPARDRSPYQEYKYRRENKQDSRESRGSYKPRDQEKKTGGNRKVTITNSERRSVKSRLGNRSIDYDDVDATASTSKKRARDDEQDGYETPKHPKQDRDY